MPVVEKKRKASVELEREEETAVNSPKHLKVVDDITFGNIDFGGEIEKKKTFDTASRLHFVRKR